MDLTKEQEARSTEFIKTAEPFYVRSMDMDYADVVRRFREIEADFVARAGNDAFEVLETRRRIADFIIMSAWDHRQPIEVCRDAWNDLLRLDFSALSERCDMTWYYADCCFFNHEFAEGIAALESLIADLDQRLRAPNATGILFLEDRLQTLTNELQKLKSESRRCADPLIVELAKAIDKLSTEMADADIREIQIALNKLEDDFIARAGDDENRIREIKWRTTYQLFEALPDEVTFASCKACFDELVRLGFDDLQRQCNATRIHGQHCLDHDELEAGHAVVDPLLADLRQRLADPQVPDEMARLCRFQLNRLQDVLKKPEPYPREG